MSVVTKFITNTDSSTRPLMWAYLLFTLVLFASVVFLLRIPQDIQLGLNAQKAIKVLDNLHYPLLETRTLLSKLSIDSVPETAVHDLVELRGKANDYIESFTETAAYSARLNDFVDEVSTTYSAWINAEYDYLIKLVDIGKRNSRWKDELRLSTINTENETLFLDAMRLLSDGEVYMHQDIEQGQRAYKMFQWAVALLGIYLISVLYFVNRMSKRAHIQREKNLEVTLKSIGDAVIATDVQGKVTMMNPEAERLTGWGCLEARGQMLSDVFKVFNEDSGEPVDELVEKVRTEKKIVVLAEDSMLISLNGNRYQIYENGAPIYNDNGEIIGVVLVFRDITQQHQLKKRLNESAARLQRVVGTSMDAVIVIDEGGYPEEWNPAAESMFGWSYDEIIKQPIQDTIIPAEFREPHLQGVKGLIENNDVPQFIAKRIESIGLHKDGHVFPIELAMTSIQTDKGWVFNAYIRDLTEQKENEALIDKHHQILSEAQRLTGMGYWDYSIVENTLEWSDEVYKIFEIDPEAIRPSYEVFLDSIHPDDREKVNTAYTESIKNRTSYYITYRIQTSSGIRVLMSQCQTTYSDDGEPVRSLGLVQDITELQAAEESILKKDSLLHKSQRIAKLGYWELDLVENTLEWSDEIFRIFCLDPKQHEPSYELFMDKVHPEDREWVDAAYNESIKNKTMYSIVHRVETDEGIKVVHEQCDTRFDDAGNPLKSLGVVQDVTEQTRNIDELRIAATMFKTHAGILITDTDGTIIRVNPAFEEMTGYSSRELIGNNPNILQSGKQSDSFYEDMWKCVSENGMWQGELWNRRKDGRLYSEWLTITAVKDDCGEVTHYVGTTQDITERKQAEQQLEYLAYHDDLTNVANRRLLVDRLHNNVLSCKRHNEVGAVLLLDLDRFKDLNDSLGHTVGDQVLRQVASRLKSIVREEDTVARLGGDDFVLVLSSVGKSSADTGFNVQGIAEKIRLKLSESYILRDGQCYSSTSIGITLFPENSETVDDILKHADTALHRAKRQGGNTICFYHPDMQAEVDSRVAIGDGLRDAIKNHEFILHYQPQMDAKGQLLGAEVLLRWQHPERGMVPPGEFISVAEDTGLILEIGYWVLTEAVRTIAKWHASGLCERSDLRLSVNVSPRQFHQPDFVLQVLRILKDADVPPSCIELELTESMLMDDLGSVIGKMAELRSHGVHISIDDFGTGYSSLAYLKKLPLDQLKIDQSFIRDITSESDSAAAVVETIISMARHLGLDVIAEGVETREQLDFLIDKGCEAFQGYYFDKPLPASKFVKYIQVHREKYRA